MTQINISTKVAERIKRDKSYFYFLNRGALQEKAETPYWFLRKMAALQGNDLYLIDRTMLLGMIYYKGFSLEILMDRDFFEIVFVDRKTKIRQHVKSWQFCSDLQPFTFETWEIFLCCLLDEEIKRYQEEEKQYQD